MRIGDFSKKTGLSVYTIRYYEKKGLIRVNRDSNNIRIYNKNDIEWVIFLKKLKDTGMLLRDMKMYSDLRYEGENTVKKRLEILKKHKKNVENEIKKWNNYLNNLEDKIKIYKSKIKE